MPVFVAVAAPVCACVCVASGLWGAHVLVDPLVLPPQPLLPPPLGVDSGCFESAQQSGALTLT